MTDQPIRIAYIIGKMWAGGVEAVVFNYYRAIDHKKIQFDFFYDADSTVDPPSDLLEAGARFIKLPPYQQLPKYIRELRRYLRTEQYTIIHSHLNTMSVFPLFAAWREHIPVRIAHNHSVPGGHEFKRNTLKYFLRCFAKVFSTDYFACSEKAGRWMFGDRSFNSGKVYVLKNAVDFDRFITDSRETEERKKDLGLQDRFVIGHIGRFTYAKNHHFLLDIFEEIEKERDDARLLLVGDGELHGEIVKEIKNRALKEKVLLIGKVQNPEKYYCLNNVLVFPSVFEGLSLSTVESQIAGVPVVISKAIPEEAIISDGCVYMDLNEPASKWAETVIVTAQKDIRLSDLAKDYNIQIQAPKLEAWYLKAMERTKTVKS